MAAFHALREQRTEENMARERGASDIHDLIGRLRDTFGKDFSSYRLTCLERRLALRMSTLGVKTIDAYIAYLNENPDEIEQLLNAVTIHVTEFFRDRDVYAVLSREIIPEIVAKKLASSWRHVRVWSAGCSTGEEAYSIAITFMRYIEAAGIALDLEVFGTDISREACSAARKGVYPEGRIASVAPNLRERYFEPVESGYRVSPQLRRTVKFSVHDLFSAPPYSLLDVIVCRNVLIHFDHSARNGVLARFHAALGDDGILMLGKSEAVAGGATELFELRDPKNKIYRKRSSVPAPEGGRT
jgi:two-component system CheB/CheR fusion protein